jgi:hypothetical protein
MKSRFKLLGLAALMALVGTVGCKNRVPTGSGAYPSNPTDYTSVCKYDAASTLVDQGAVNPTLLGLGGTPGSSYLLLGGGGLQSFFGWLAAGASAMTVVTAPPAGNTSSGAAHNKESFTDNGDASYPSNQIRIRMKGTGYYDLGNFDGVKFLMYTSPNDDALKRRFSIGVGATLPVLDDSQGYCSNTKRNNFGKDLSSTNGKWTQTTISFAEMTQESGYAAASPPDFASHMHEAIWLQWSEGRNNSKGVCHVDYWIDDVVFY